MLPLALRFEVPLAVGSSFTSTGPLRIDIPAGTFLPAGFALSIALSTLLGMVLRDFCPDPEYGMRISRDRF